MNEKEIGTVVGDAGVEVVWFMAKGRMGKEADGALGWSFGEGKKDVVGRLSIEMPLLTELGKKEKEIWWGGFLQRGRS
jgi:hypothetical protein